MKKKTQSIRQDFKMPHIFREDLEEIEDILKEVSAHEYKLESQSFEYKKIGEISQNSDVTNKFHIQTYLPHISIDFNNGSAQIYAGDDDIKTIGAVKKITEVILKRERKILYWLSELFVSFSLVLFAGPILILLVVDNDAGKLGLTDTQGIFLVIILPIIAIIWWIIGYNNRFKKFSIVEFKYKKDKSNFLSRNKDQVILITIGALLGALLTLFSQKLFG